MGGWNLSLTLAAKQFSKIGDSLAESLANFDPETATQVDREALQGRLRDAAIKLAGYRMDAAREQKEADDLHEQVRLDTLAADVLIQKFTDGKIDEATLNAFADELEVNKARMPKEDSEAVEAKQIVDEFEGMFNTLKTRLDQFDRKAADIRRQLALSEAQNERENLRLQNQDEMNKMRTGMAETSTALGAMSRRADKLSIQAAGSKILADAGQAPLDRQKAIDEARSIASGAVDTGSESVVDRLKRLSAQ